MAKTLNPNSKAPNFLQLQTAPLTSLQNPNPSSISLFAVQLVQASRLWQLRPAPVRVTLLLPRPSLLYNELLKSTSASTSQEIPHVLRSSLEATEELKEFVDFFLHLLHSPTILDDPATWILFSQLDLVDQHIYAAANIESFESPWDWLAVDEIAPEFRNLLKGHSYAGADYFHKHPGCSPDLFFSYLKRLVNIFANSFDLLMDAKEHDDGYG